jgi:hypothetical protein
MVFKPSSFYLGKTVSLSINIVALACLVIMGGVFVNNRRKSSGPAS